MNTRTIEIRKLQSFAMAALIAGAIAIMLGLSLGVSQAWAGAQPGYPTLEDLCKKTYTISFGCKEPFQQSYSSAKSPTKKITETKSTDTSVATVDVDKFSESGRTYYYLQVMIKKTGTTKISFKLGGKKHTVKYVVKPYKNYLKSFKVGSKNYKAQFDPGKDDYASYIVGASAKAKSISGKVQVKLKSGWKIKKIWYWTQSGNNWKMHYIKNGATAKKAKTLYVWAQNGTHRQIFQLHTNS